MSITYARSSGLNCNMPVFRRTRDNEKIKKYNNLYVFGIKQNLKVHVTYSFVYSN